MEISSTNAFYSGLNGIQSGQRRVEQAAGEIAGNAVTQSQQSGQNAPTNQVGPTSQASERSQPDLTESLVALRVGENEVRANARVIETADEALGTLIDTRA